MLLPIEPKNSLEVLLPQWLEFIQAWSKDGSLIKAIEACVLKGPIDPEQKSLWLLLEQWANGNVDGGPSAVRSVRYSVEDGV